MITTPSSCALVVCALGLLAVACGGAGSPPADPQPAPPAQAGAALTAAECEAAGGEVVGDIGDGAVHRPDYRCARSGQPPIGAIASEPGQPIAIEGAVCCR